jgi:hypothetical protein
MLTAVQGRVRLLTVAVLLAFVGCAQKAQPLDRSHEHLRKIGAAYMRHNLEKKAPPKNLDDLKQFLAEDGDPAEILRSPDDGEQYVICWNVPLLERLSWAKGTPVLAYEKRGSDGHRYVLTTLRSVELMSDDDFQQASFPPGHKQ